MMPPTMAPMTMQRKLTSVILKIPISILRISVLMMSASIGLASSKSAPPAMARNAVMRKRKTLSSIK